MNAETKLVMLKKRSNVLSQMQASKRSTAWYSIPAEITDEWIREQLTVTPSELEAFNQGLLCDFAEARGVDLLDDIYKKTLESIIGPLGLGKFMGMYDRIGGNVDTIHNARKEIRSKKLEEAYEDRDEYDSDRYHQDDGYTKANEQKSQQRQNGNLKDVYTGQTLSQNQKVDQDHVISAKEINDDPGRVLAELDGVGLANTDSNLVATDRSINRSKQAKSMAKFVAYLEKGRAKRQKDIANLKQKPESELTEQERKKLKKLESLESADTELMMKVDEAARNAYNSKINKAYYSSGKFYKDLGVSSGLEGAKMGFQQAFGLLCVDLTNALFDEAVDVYRHGFVTGVEKENTLDAFKLRLRRVAASVWMNWKKLVAAFKDGTISGIISNVITTIINIFFTTAKNIVRLLREGTLVVYRAAKSLLFAPKDMDSSEAWDAALKIVVAGAGTLGGIALDEAIGKMFLSVPLLAPIAPTLSAIISGIVTGLATSVALFAIDKWDPFGARDLKKRRHIREKLGNIEAQLLSDREKLLQEFSVTESGMV